MTKEKVNLTEMFKEYAKQELEFIKNSDPEKVYHRVMPNFKDKNKGTIEFIHKYIIIGGMIDGDTIYLNKLKVTKYGKEDDIDSALAKITEIVNKGDMKLVNQLWYNWVMLVSWSHLLDKNQQTWKR